ncbi:MAG: hypothetical protein IT372_31615 [Polyangiaceae bacterium]|nr:hypothetical protein [Polyangiaceae bacterium]
MPVSIYVPPFDNSTTLELFDEDIGAIVGYMFASEGCAPITQEQRWVLYEQYISPPTRAVRLRPSREHCFTELSAFVSALSDVPLWRSGARYVKVNAQSHGSVPEDPSPPPFPAMTLKPSRFKSTPGANQQIDDRPGLFQSNRVGGEDLLGFALGTAIVPSTISGISQNHEYWFTTGGYRVLAGGEETLLKGSAEITYTSVDELLSFARKRWTSGSTLTIASCVYAMSIPLDP